MNITFKLANHKGTVYGVLNNGIITYVLDGSTRTIQASLALDIKTANVDI